MKTYKQFKAELEEGFTVKLVKRGMSIGNFGGKLGKKSKIGSDKYAILDTRSGKEVGVAHRSARHNDIFVKMHDGSGFNITGSHHDPQTAINKHVKFEKMASKYSSKE